MQSQDIGSPARTEQNPMLYKLNNDGVLDKTMHCFNAVGPDFHIYIYICSFYYGDRYNTCKYTISINDEVSISSLLWLTSHFCLLEK